MRAMTEDQDQRLRNVEVTVFINLLAVIVLLLKGCFL